LVADGTSIRAGDTHWDDAHEAQDDRLVLLPRHIPPFEKSEVTLARKRVQ
jgi:hypothetical protein